MTVLDRDTGVYAQAPQSGTVDDALVYFAGDLKMRLPLAPILTTRLPAEMTKRVKSADYVELTDLHNGPPPAPQRIL